MKNFNFGLWVNNGELKIMLESVDKDLLKDFWDTHMEGRCDWYPSADLEFLRNFKPLPKKWESWRKLILTIIKNGDNYTDYRLKSIEQDLFYVELGWEKMDESLIEPVLNVLEDWPEFGVGIIGRRKKIRLTSICGEYIDEEWIIKPKEGA